MQITQIKQIGKTARYNLFVDEKWAGIFMDEILAKYGFKTLQEIEEDEFEKIKKENDERVSFDMAVSYLERYVVSEKGLKDHLKKKAICPSVIAKTIEKLQEYGYVDDERFAKSYFSSMANSKGKRVIANKLREKGVAMEIIDQLLQTVDEEGELERATGIARKFVKNRDNSAKSRQKCLAHLIYKGYDYIVAQQATKITFENKGETEDDRF